MYKYKHKTTGEVIVTSNKVTSKNWEIVNEKNKTGTANAGGTKSGSAKTGGNKAGGSKKGNTKKEEPKEEAEGQ